MPLSPDFHDILEVFVYNNLNVVIRAIASPVAASAGPAKAATPQALTALQTAALDNFTQLGLKPDIEEIARIFFASLPPTVLAPTPTTPLTPILPAPA